MEHICDHCNLSFESGPKLGSHKRNCKLNPRREEKLRKISTALRHDTRQYDFTCFKCGNSFSLVLRESQLENKNCGRFCSRACANSRVHTPESLEKISKSLCGRTSTRIREKKCKHCKYCNEIVTGRRTVCRPKCPEAKKHVSEMLSKALKGKSGGYREGGGRGHGCHYNGVWLDSTWELIFVQKLDALSVRWERDVGKHRYQYVDESGNERLYYPDFFLPDFGGYVEVKGYWTPATMHKMQDATTRNNLRLVVFDSIEDILSITTDDLHRRFSLLLTHSWRAGSIPARRSAQEYSRHTVHVYLGRKRIE